MARLRVLRLFLSTLITIVVLAFAAHSVLAEPTKSQKPVPNALLLRMKMQNVDRYAPIYMRAFKKERIIEVWKQARNGNYALIKAFPICRFSGTLGPKVKIGDQQTPEGFYSITPGQLQPNSSYHLAFNIGFPNAYDRANGRTGNYLMVHGNCVSVGCFAMTDSGIEKIYALTREAFAGGQRSIPFHSFPFRMTGRNLIAHSLNKNSGFWASLKPAYDVFEATHQPPRVQVRNRSYVVLTSTGQKIPQIAPQPQPQPQPKAPQPKTPQEQANQNKGSFFSKLKSTSLISHILANRTPTRAALSQKPLQKDAQTLSSKK